MSSFFETIKIEEGKIFHLEWHQRRYEHTLKQIGALKFTTLAYHIKAPKEGLWRCKIVYSANGIERIEYHPYKKRPIRSIKLIESDIEYPLKSSDRSGIDKMFAKKGKCDEIIVVKNGKLRDTSIANIAFYDGSSWLTPDTPLLAGTTRARYLYEKKLALSSITTADLSGFSKIAFLNAMVDFDIMSIEKLLKDQIIVK